jgi:hypothetical protein
MKRAVIRRQFQRFGSDRPEVASREQKRMKTYFFLFPSFRPGTGTVGLSSTFLDLGFYLDNYSEDLSGNVQTAVNDMTKGMLRDQIRK